MLCLFFLSFWRAHAGSVINAASTAGVGWFVVVTNSSENTEFKKEVKEQFQAVQEQIQDLRNYLQGIREEFWTELRVTNGLTQGSIMSILKPNQQGEMLLWIAGIEQCLRSGKDCSPGHHEG